MHKVITLEAKDITWPFDGSPNFTIPAKEKSWSTTIHVTPFPCYTHNADLVVDMVDVVDEAFPIGFPVNWFIIPHDTDKQTNAWADMHNIYDESTKIGDRYAFDPFVVMAGKRIPIHPAMTRYLVAHEYGHHVQRWIEYKRGLDERGSASMFEIEYAAMRGIECNKAYGGLKWHTNIREIIANDFRVGLCGVETEFWPHDVPPPDLKISRFWSDMKEQYGFSDK